MDEPKNKTADRAATAVMFAVILVVSVALALMTDMQIVVRGVIAVVVGLVAAGITYIAVRNRRV